MPGQLRRNAIVVCALAAAFWWTFMFAKHDPALRPVIPFGDDPYDAVGSFGVIVAALLAVVSLVRAFRPDPTPLQRLYVVRSQASVVLAAFVTIAADLVAMVRHPPVSARTAIVALLGGLLLAASIVLVLILRSHPRSEPGRWSGAVLASLLVIAALAVYPEQIIRNPLAHLATVVFGAVALFAPMRMLLMALLPGDIESRPFRGRWMVMSAVAATVGAFAFIGEMSEGTGGAPAGRLLLVATVFIGLGVAGLLVAYAFLGKPLGIGA